jgi:hypothetical protein
MDTTNLRREWLKGITADASQVPGVVRAAASLFVMLGRACIWPIKTLEHDLELAISGLSKVLSAAECAKSPEFVAAVRDEIKELESRRKLTQPVNHLAIRIGYGVSSGRRPRGVA